MFSRNSMTTFWCPHMNITCKSCMHQHYMYVCRLKLQRYLAFSLHSTTVQGWQEVQQHCTSVLYSGTLWPTNELWVEQKLKKVLAKQKAIIKVPAPVQHVHANTEESGSAHKLARLFGGSFQVLAVNSNGAEVVPEIIYVISVYYLWLYQRKD